MSERGSRSVDVHAGCGAPQKVEKQVPQRRYSAPKYPKKALNQKPMAPCATPARLQKIVLHHTDQSSTGKKAICLCVPCNQIPLFHIQDMGGTTRFQKATCHPMSSGRGSHQRFCVSSISMALATMKPTAPTTCPYVPDNS